jgi:hypothetical protein
VAPHRFKHIEKTDNITFDIGARVLNAVSNARLRRKMHYDVRFACSNSASAVFGVRQIALDKRKMFESTQLRKPRTLELRIIIGVQLSAPATR